MATRNYAAIARRYAEAVVGGDIAACKWVRLACQRQLDDLKRFQGRNPPYRFNPRLTDKLGRSFQPADNLCAFVERLPHVKGPLAGLMIGFPLDISEFADVFRDGRSHAGCSTSSRRIGMPASMRSPRK